MIWLFLAVTAIATALVKLGALSVWVTVLSIAVKVALGLCVVAVLFVLWQRYYRRKS